VIVRCSKERLEMIVKKCAMAENLEKLDDEVKNSQRHGCRSGRGSEGSGIEFAVATWNNI